MRKFLDGFEEAESQILLGDVAQQFAKQRLVVRPDGTRKHAPAIPEDEMPLPLNRIGSTDMTVAPVRVVRLCAGLPAGPRAAAGNQL